MFGWLAACSGAGVTFGFTETGGGGRGGFEMSAEIAGGPAAPLLIVDLPFDGTLLVTWFDEGGVRRISTDEVGDHHEVTILGLLPDHDYELEVTGFGGEAGASQTHVQWRTDPLPADFPTFRTPVAGGLDEPDLLVAARSGTDDRDPTGTDYVSVLRADGRVVWWLDLGDVVQDVALGDDGFYALLGTANPRVEQWTWSGEKVATFSVGGAGTRIDTTFSGRLHGSLELVGRGFAVVQRVRTEGADLPLDYDGLLGRGPRVFADEHVIEFDRAGRVSKETALSGRWPTDRLGWGSLDASPEGPSLWADAREVTVDGDGSYVWSLTNQDAVVSTAPDGSIEWVLGQPYGWSPDLAAHALTGAVPLPWHPTSAELGPVGSDGRRRLVVFDSGRYGTAPPTPPLADGTARVLGYLVNERRREVSLEFEVSDLGQGALSTSIGSVSIGVDGTILAAFGAVGAPVVGHVAVFDPGNGQVVRHQVADGGGGGLEIRAATSLPPLDSLIRVLTSDLRIEDSGGHTGDERR